MSMWCLSLIHILTGTSISDLFIAGVFPGLLMGLGYLVMNLSLIHIFKAVKDRNGEEAARIMEEHLDKSIQKLKAAWSKETN